MQQAEGHDQYQYGKELHSITHIYSAHGGRGPPRTTYIRCVRGAHTRARPRAARHARGARICVRGADTLTHICVSVVLFASAILVWAHVSPAPVLLLMMLY